MAKYSKCPRCELNYIDLTKQQYCDVCLKEMKGLIEDDPVLDEELEEETELCPICGENFMRVGEKMCDECKKKSEYEEEPSESDENDDEWRTYLDEEPSETEDIGIEEDDADMSDDDDEEEEEETEESDDEEDLEYVTGDDIYKYQDGDDDDEDEEDEEGDDDDDDSPRGKKNKSDDDDF